LKGEKESSTENYRIDWEESFTESSTLAENGSSIARKSGIVSSTQTQLTRKER
jgi:hypothetical protein